MAGMKIVTVSTDAQGNVNMAELKEKVRDPCLLPDQRQSLFGGGYKWILSPLLHSRRLLH
jgi:hypothetical protein